MSIFCARGLATIPVQAPSLAERLALTLESEDVQPLLPGSALTKQRPDALEWGAVLLSHKASWDQRETLLPPRAGLF